MWRIELRAYGSDGAVDMEWNLMERKKLILKWNGLAPGSACKSAARLNCVLHFPGSSVRRTTRVL